MTIPRKTNQLKTAFQYFFPEVGAGGYTHVDGTIEFFSRVNALIDKDMVILDFGAGRGRALSEDSCEYRRTLRSFKGKVLRIVGIDVDHAVLEHPELDESHVLAIDEPLPFPDASFDLIVSDYVFEHVDNPEFVSSELSRVLKPGGWLCARTPNKNGYVGLAARLVPNKFHSKIVKKVQNNAREAKDVFPTRYKLNSMRSINQYFNQAEWVNYTYSIDAEPAYFGNSKILWFVMIALFKIMPKHFDTVLLIFMQKR